MCNKAITLDPRIPKGLASVISPMDVFSKDKADRFMSMAELVGYAADRLDDFSNLEGLTANLVRCVSVNPGALYPFECSLVMNPCVLVKHQFFIPKSAVYRPHDDIPKARPFTIAEFNKCFKLGSSVHFIEKDGGHERWVMYTGYCIDKSGVYVYLGPRVYELQDLFDDFKLAIGYVKKADREEPLWGVFGVDPEVYEYVQ